MGVTTYSSAIFNFMPEWALEFYKSVRARDREAVMAGLRDFVLPYITLRNRGKGYAVSIVKAGMKAIGRDAGPVRLPLTELPGRICRAAGPDRPRPSGSAAPQRLGPGSMRTAHRPVSRPDARPPRQEDAGIGRTSASLPPPGVVDGRFPCSNSASCAASWPRRRSCISGAPPSG
jgi:hypothetical protein